MTPAPYTEDTLVQQTTAEYLAQKLGWESVFAYNNETFGPDGMLGRSSDREVVLTRYLRAKIVAFNPGLPDAAYDDAVRQIVSTSATQTMQATNREKHELIKTGVAVTFRNGKGELEKRRLRVIDFDNPQNNISSVSGSSGSGATSTAAGGYRRLCQRSSLSFHGTQEHFQRYPGGL